MVSWKRRLEELVAEINEVASPAKIRKDELETLIREQCREIIAEELQKITVDMLYNKIFVSDPKVHQEPLDSSPNAIWVAPQTTTPGAGTTITISDSTENISSSTLILTEDGHLIGATNYESALADYYNMHGAQQNGEGQ